MNNGATEFLVAEKVFNVAVNGVVDVPLLDENRFGVSLQAGNDFVQAFRNLRINGFKVTHKYPLEWESASVHAETFAWNLFEYKVNFTSCEFLLLLVSGTDGELV